jgi:hypothetical protein
MSTTEDEFCHNERKKELKHPCHIVSHFIRGKYIAFKKKKEKMYALEREGITRNK